jgi:dTMP kinase
LASAFITFEGIDGCGKSTQLRMLASELRLRGREVVTTREPGGTPLGSRIRQLVLDEEEQVDPLAELLLYAADRAQHVRTLVRPALESGHVVLSDRYADATVAYQGAGRGFPDEIISELVALATGGLMPDLTLLIDVPPEVAHARVGPPRDRIEDRPEAYRERVRAGFLEAAGSYPAPIVVVDGAADPRTVAARLQSEVARALALDPRP